MSELQKHYKMTTSNARHFHNFQHNALYKLKGIQSKSNPENLTNAFYEILQKTFCRA